MKKQQSLKNILFVPFAIQVLSKCRDKMNDCECAISEWWTISERKFHDPTSILFIRFNSTVHAFSND